MRYDKLVRDRIPEIIAGRGGRAVTHVAVDEEYRRKLREKLQEEVAEYLEADDANELADIAEVIRALAARQGISPESLEELRRKKEAERGGFYGRVILEES